VTDDLTISYEVAHFDDLVSAVRRAAQTTFDDAPPDDVERTWAKAMLAELELVAGDAKSARTLFREATYTQAANHSNVSSMLEQVRLYESLGFRPGAVAPVIEVLSARLEKLAQRAGGPTEAGPRFGKVLVASGHMTDAPGRRSERFPQRKEGAVRERLAAQLDRWAVGAGDLAICGGARGADILFAELCADRRAEVWLFLPLPDAEFLEKSVRHPEGDWERRFFDLRERDNVKTFSQPDRLKSPPKGASVFARNNLWMLNTARVEADDPSRLYAVLVWDEKPTGDGPGGTSDFAARVRQLGGRLAPVINPTAL
jgi:hypothetical protein